MIIAIPSGKIYGKENIKVRDNVIERLEINANTLYKNTVPEIVLSLPPIGGFSIKGNEGFEDLDTGTTEINGVKITTEKFSAGGAIWHNQFVDFELEFPIGTTDVDYLYKNLTITLERTIAKTPNDRYLFSHNFDYSTGSNDLEFKFAVIKGTPTPNYLGLIYQYMALYVDEEYVYQGSPITLKFPNKLKGKIAYSIGIDTSDDGIFERTINTTITFRIKNNLKKESETLIVGTEESKKTNAIDGNELMQTSNYLYEEIKRPIKILSPALTSDGVGHTYRLEHNYNFDEAITYVNFQGEEGRIVKYGKEFYCTIDSIYNKYVDNTIEVSLTGTKVNALKKMFGDTQKEYKNGKETATIRCSISDYYDFYTDEKVIAVDNSTRRMCFNEYDQVIPMVYGADGKEKPMSLKNDGTPKVFTVLGTKIFFDGAVWQELYLQET